MVGFGEWRFAGILTDITYRHLLPTSLTDITYRHHLPTSLTYISYLLWFFSIQKPVAYLHLLTYYGFSAFKNQSYPLISSYSYLICDGSAWPARQASEMGGNGIPSIRLVHSALFLVCACDQSKADLQYGMNRQTFSTYLSPNVRPTERKPIFERRETPSAPFPSG